MHRSEDVPLIDLLLRPDCLPFSVALLLMLLIGAVEAVGLGSAALGLDAHADLPKGLDWLNIGHLPLLVLLVVFLALFGTAGLAIETAALLGTGGVLAWPLAVPAALAAALPLTRLASAGLGRILPRDETTAVPLDALIGRRARIVIGTAGPGNPARARVVDVHGQPHFVMVEPEDSAIPDRFDDTMHILLTRRDGAQFRAVAIESDYFTQAELR
ncbi:hypothetical protein IP88_00200 [alpha proteobacterium AAP81b]|nr:hypothetical protein IP88_00200 [alpha proteobacterium AAP81b]